MSSNMAIPKTCSYCGKAFIAKTTLTKYCCHVCNQRHYKQKAKEEKIQKNISRATANNAKFAILANCKLKLSYIQKLFIRSGCS